jgi:hypothetical protein
VSARSVKEEAKIDQSIVSSIYNRHLLAFSFDDPPA